MLKNLESYFTRVLFLALMLVSIPVNSSFAQVPGDACAAGDVDVFRRVVGAANPGIGYFLVCDGSNWQEVMTFSTVGGDIMFNSGALPAAPVHIDGEVIVNESGLSCSATTEGAIRYNNTGQVHDFCNGTSWAGIGGVGGIWTAGTGDIIYYNSGTPLVGIGTVTPGNALDVVGTVQLDKMKVDGTTGLAAPNSGGGTPSTLSDLTDVIITTPGNTEVLTYNGANWVNSAAAGGGGLWTAGAGDDIYYNTGTPRVGIGTTTPQTALDVVGSLYHTGIIVDLSDRRMKKNIHSLPSQIAKINQLEPVSFIMKDDPENNTELGFIAQDVEKLYPDLVTTLSNDTKAMNYIGLIAPLIKATQEQQALIEELQAEINLLKEQGKRPPRLYNQ